MARVDNSALHDFVTGEKVTEQILDQNFKVMQAAVNDNDKVLEDLGIGSFAPATFNSLLQTSTTFNQLKFGYVKQITDPLDTRITSLETVQTKPPAIQQFVANDGQTVFTLTNMTYDVGTGETSVEIDGIAQVAGEEYTETNSTTITLVEAVPAGAEVRVIVSQTPVALSEKLAGYDTSITTINSTLNKIAEQFTSSPPITGTLKLADKIWNTTPTSGGNIGWVCTNAGTINGTAWVTGTAYTVGQQVNANNKVYTCAVAGTSGATAPSHTTGTATDGTVTWNYTDILAVVKTFGVIS